MKKIRKVLALVLALVMTLALTCTAMAEENKGTITITNAVVGETYQVYRIFDLQSYNPETEAYAYTLAAKWTGFDQAKGVSDYFTITAGGNINWVGGKENTTSAAFAKLAMQYAVENKITPDANSQTAASEDNAVTTVELKFESLDLGYYLIESSMGTLCSLTTTNPSVKVEEKNEAPELTKRVQNTEDDSFGSSTTATMGDTVNFQLMIEAESGAKNYVVHDTMDAGLTFNEDIAITVTWAKDSTSKPLTAGTEESHEGKDYYVVTKETDDYGAEQALRDGCTFHIVFTETFCDTLASDDKIHITYSATLNANALIGTDASGNGNVNKAHLSYGGAGETPETPDETVNVYTYTFQLIKTDSSDQVLTGATFKLYKTETDGNPILLVKETDAETNEVYYRPAITEEEKTAAADVLIEAGSPCIKGLANGTYYLEEVKAPDGYNKVSGRKSVIIRNANNVGTTVDNEGATVYTSASGGLQVVNNKGNILPSTGGVGTTLFYVAGGVLVVGGAILLVAKKRATGEDD